ncbi:MAG: HAD hydrolase-like protein, partial [Paludibacteraceae bacterium]|nr:HAD hydrolase-like protein [Paludibacteraceae bacterium]
MKKLVIFDLDGTLLDTIADLGTAGNQVLAAHGYPTHPIEAYRHFVGRGIRKLIERALSPHTPTEEETDRLLTEFKAYYIAHKTDLTRPYKGIDALLAALQKSGVRLAVASNKFQQGTEELIRHYWGEDLFEVVLGQREGVPTKPDPQIVSDILQRCGLPAA